MIRKDFHFPENYDMIDWDRIENIIESKGIKCKTRNLIKSRKLIDKIHSEEEPLSLEYINNILDYKNEHFL